MRKLKTKFYGILGAGCIVLTLFLMTNACKNETTKPVAETAGQTKLVTNETGTLYVAISNTDAKTIEVYDYRDVTWNSTTRLWSFLPTTALGYSSGAVAAMGVGPGDFRVHYTTGFPGKSTSAFTIQGGRWLGVGSYIPDGTGGYAKGKKLWEYTFATTDDPNDHGVELLPNGNLVVAAYGGATAGKGNWLRVYNTSTPTSTNYAEVSLEEAHAVLWDDRAQVLWAGGQIHIAGVPYHGIFCYAIGGTRTAPTITELVGRRAVKQFGAPPAGLKYPHDIGSCYDDTSKLIYGDHTGIYFYTKATKTFTPAPGAAYLYFGADVAIKSAQKQANGGKIMVTQADVANGCTYGTNKVDFYDPVTGALSFTRTANGICSIYRARVWAQPY